MEVPHVEMGLLCELNKTLRQYKYNGKAKLYLNMIFTIPKIQQLFLSTYLSGFTVDADLYAKRHEKFGKPKLK